MQWKKNTNYSSDKIVNTKVKKYFYNLITINYHIQTITSPIYYNKNEDWYTQIKKI